LQRRLCPFAHRDLTGVYIRLHAFRRGGPEDLGLLEYLAVQIVEDSHLFIRSMWERGLPPRWAWSNAICELLAPVSPDPYCWLVQCDSSLHYKMNSTIVPNQHICGVPATAEAVDRTCCDKTRPHVIEVAPPEIPERRLLHLSKVANDPEKFVVKWSDTGKCRCSECENPPLKGPIHTLFLKPCIDTPHNLAMLSEDCHIVSLTSKSPINPVIVYPRSIGRRAFKRPVGDSRQVDSLKAPPIARVPELRPPILGGALMVRAPVAGGATNKSLLVQQNCVSDLLGPGPGPQNGQGKKNAKKKQKQKGAKPQQKVVVAYPEGYKNLMKKSYQSLAANERKSRPKPGADAKYLSARFSPAVTERIEQLVASMCAPGTVAPVRWASPYSNKLTAVAAPFARPDAVWNLDDAARSEVVIYQFRDASRHTVTTKYMAAESDPQTNYFEYEVIFNDDSLGANDVTANYCDLTRLIRSMVHTTAVGSVTTTDPLTTTLYMRSPYMNAAAGYAFKPHGQVFLAGSENGIADDGPRFFWLDQGAEMYLDPQTAILAATAGTFGIALDQFTEKGIERAVLWLEWSVADAGTAKILSITNAGYYAMRIVFNNVQFVGDADFTFAMRAIYRGDYADGMRVVYAHEPLPYYLANAASVSAYRILGHSIMYSQRASYVGMQGSIAAYLAGANELWFRKYLTYSQIAAANGDQVSDAKLGMFGSGRIEKASDLDFGTSLTLLSDGSIADSFYRIVPSSPYLAMAVQVKGTVGREGFYSVNASIEYSTPDTWRVLELPNLTSEHCAAAMEILQQVPAFTENPTHWQKILSAIKKGANTGLRLAEKYGPAVMQGARFLATI